MEEDDLEVEQEVDALWMHSARFTTSTAHTGRFLVAISVTRQQERSFPTRIPSKDQPACSSFFMLAMLLQTPIYLGTLLCGLRSKFTTTSNRIVIRT